MQIADVMERYDVSRETVDTWIRSGELAAINVAPHGSKRKMYRVTEEAIQAFEKARQGKPARPAPVTRKIPQYV